MSAATITLDNYLTGHWTGGLIGLCQAGKGMVEDRADNNPIGQCAFAFTHWDIEGRCSPDAFGSVDRSVVRNRCAAVTRVTWWYQPSQERPSTWSSPRPAFGSR